MSVAVRVLAALDSDWPRSLDDVSPRIASLCVLGDPAALQGPLVSVVGTRNATPYGERVTAQLVRSLVESGVGIVSGLARGIDAAAHRAALDAGGRTVAVLGTGADVPYPAGHRSLHARIIQTGAVVSEVPLGTRAFPGCFPKRNRIIAALTPLTLVVEAGFRSGAQSTASAALALGRTVAAVPGPIDSPQSDGTNALIRDGAQMINCAGDLHALIGIAPPPAEAIAARLTGAAREVWDALAPGAALIEDLATMISRPLGETLAAVSTLELAGRVTVAPDDSVRRVRPAHIR